MTQWILTSSLLIAVVLLIRKLAGDKLSARLRYALWGLVLLRLLLPVTIGESSLSVQNWMPEKEAQSTVTQELPVYTTSDSEEIINATQPTQSVTAPAEVSKSIAVLPVVYVTGCVLVGLVFLLSNLLFWLRLRRSREYLTEQHLGIGSVSVYVSDAIETPCMYGLLRPAVYVTPAVLADKTAQQYVLAHELTHYRHGDHLWSFLRCVAVILHWYNPLVWTASFASQQDGELACDEGALRRVGEENRREYARTLINLTCVGYGGMLTTATSMTGRKCDLRNRVVRISKNPKMTITALIAALVIAALAAVMLFTGAATPAIEGVWGMEISALGVGMEQGTEAYMEYEFYDGRGRRIDHIAGDIRSADSFTYTLHDNTVTLDFGEGNVQEYTWIVDKEGLSLSDYRVIRHLTAVEREEVPYLPDGYLEIITLVLTRPTEGQTVESLSVSLTDVQQAQLLELLRTGATKETRKEHLNVDGFKISVCTSGNAFSIANGLVYTDSAEEGYVLSNAEQIEAWLNMLPWEGEISLAHLVMDGFVTSDMVGIVDAEMILYNRRFKADPARLAFLEELLITAEDSFASACPFEGWLIVTLSDGRQLAVTPALDSCAAFRIGDAYYEYGNQFAYDDEGSYDNTELLAIFGLDFDKIMELWETARETTGGEVIGTMEDVGDVVRVMNDVMEPTRLSDDDRELLMALLAQGIGEPIGKLDSDFATDYYTIFSSGQDTADGYVWFCDNGDFYMDSVQYELSTANEVLSLLDRQYPIRISHDGRPMEADVWDSVLGEVVYFELQGVPEDAEVTWTSSDESVCKVDGDAYGATVHVIGMGEAQIAAEYRSDWNTKGYTFYITCNK